MDLEKNYSVNRRVVLEKVFRNIAFMIIVYLFIFFIGQMQFQQYISFNNSYFRWATYFLIVYVTYKNYILYKDMVNYLHTLSLIREYKRNKRLSGLKSFRYMYEKDLELVKEKLDIYKRFTPVPMIIFLFSLVFKENLIENLEDVVTYVNSIKSANFTLENIFIIGIFIFVLIYSWNFHKSWLQFHRKLDGYYKFREAYEELEDSLKQTQT